jgi:hypothetical protein
MPTRNLYLQERDGSLLITPRVKLDPNHNVFDSSFGADVENDLEEWTDWMRWDANAIETDSTALERKHSVESTYSDCDISDPSPVSAYSTNNDLSFEYAPFDFDETTEGSQIPATFQIFRDPRRPVQVYSTLSASEQQRLQALAMPYRVVSQNKAVSEPWSPTTSTSISTQSRSASPAPKTTTRKTKKRKSSVGDDEVPSALCQSRKRGHNAIEKRYRTNLNDKIACLRQGIPPLWRRSSTDSKSVDELDGEESDHETGEKKTCQKYGKAAILTRALEYIQYLESNTERLGDEVAGLKIRVGAFERLAMIESVIVNAPEVPGLLSRRETLESIQTGTFFNYCVPLSQLTQIDFKQIKHKSNSPAARNQRSTRAGK